MAFPTVTVEVALTTNPASTPSWTDISAYVRSFNTRRGRQFELDQMQAGTATLLLDNADRRFDPTYASGPYYGYLLPMRRIRIRAVYNGFAHDIFAGYVDGWPQQWQVQGKDSVVPIRATDGFKVLTLKRLTTSFGSQTSDARIHAVLDAVDWGSGTAWILGDLTYGVLDTTTVAGPVGDRAIDYGTSSVQASTLSNVQALQHLQLVNDSENGLLYVDKTGAVVFIGRNHLLYYYLSSRATFGDGAGEVPYSDLQLSFDDTHLWNEVRLTAQGGTEQVATDTTSESRYYSRTYSKTGLLQTTDTEVYDAANFLLTHYKEPAVRVGSMVLRPQRSDAVWVQALTREIGERVTVMRRPPGGGASIDEEVQIQGIAHDARPAQWQTTFYMSPAEPANYWILENSVYGVLDTTTRVAY